MASYDAYDNNKNGFAGYELDEGTYTFSIRTDSHTVKNQFNIDLKDNIQYQEDGTTGNTVSNKFYWCRRSRRSQSGWFGK